MPPRLFPFQQTCLRAFSTTSCLARKQRTNILNLLPPDAPAPPPYPYARRHGWYKQSQTGLYGNRMIQFGNKVSEKNEHKNRRTWKPNVQSKRLYSRALDKTLAMRVTTSVLRTIDRVGGLDNYILGRSPARLKELGPVGWNLRWLVLHTPWAQQSLGAEWRFLVEGRGPGARSVEDMQTAADAVAEDGDGILGVDLEIDGPPDAALDSAETAAEGFMHEAPAPPRGAVTL